jgi:hypothetical protein
LVFAGFPQKNLGGNKMYEDENNLFDNPQEWGIINNDLHTFNITYDMFSRKKTRYLLSDFMESVFEG